MLIVYYLSFPLLKTHKRFLFLDVSQAQCVGGVWWVPVEY